MNIEFPVLNQHGEAIAALSVPFLPRIGDRVGPAQVKAALQTASQKLSSAIGGKKHCTESRETEAMAKTEYFEDYVVGAQRTTSGRTITETDVVFHAGHSGDFFPHHVDAEFARKTPFGQRIAHGTMTFAIGVGLTASQINPVAFTYGYDQSALSQAGFHRRYDSHARHDQRKEEDAKRPGIRPSRRSLRSDQSTRRSSPVLRAYSDRANEKRRPERVVRAAAKARKREAEELNLEAILKGLTWDHPRGYSPLIQVRPNTRLFILVRIHWDRRTLREFGEAPIEQYLDRYDLIVMDHPFVGFAAAHDVLVNLAATLLSAEKRSLRRDSVGPSWVSYWYADGLWALPVDAATQVASYRPDLLSQLLSSYAAHPR